jgi:putative MATE family efflux protein
MELMETAPVGKAIIRLALPMMLSTIANMVYNMTDTFFIGQTGDPNMVAGISLAMPLFMVSQGIGTIFAIGAASYISRKLGEKRVDEARHSTAVATWTTIMVGVVITIVLLALHRPILRMMGTSDVTFPYAANYFNVICIFMIPSLINMTLSGLIRSEGATKQAMYGNLIGIVLNIVLDPIFISILNWGTAGAAWATITGWVASSVYYLLYFKSPHTVLSIKPKDFKPNKVMYAEILKIGVPAALSHIVMTFAAIFTNRIAASYSDNIIAASGVNMRITSVGFMLVMSLAMGYQPFAGYNYGARNFPRLKQGLRITMLYTTILAVFFFAVFSLFGETLTRFFINDQEVIYYGGRLLRAFVWGLPFMGMQMTLMTTYQALGKPVLATIVTLGRQFLFYLPLLFILNATFGFDGYIFAQPAADIVTSLVSLALSGFVLKEINGKAPMKAPPKGFGPMPGPGPMPARAMSGGSEGTEG